VVLGVLAIIVLATVAAVLWVNLGFAGPEAQKGNFATWGTAAVLGEIVALFVLIGRSVWLPKPRLSIQILPPQDFPAVRPGRFIWNDQKCFVRSTNVDKQVRLINSNIGQAWTVYIPQDILNQIADKEYIEFYFEDSNGHEWAAGPFLKNEYVLPLICLDEEKTKAAYAGAAQ